MEKAERELEIAALLLENGMLSKALNSAYYSIFHAMRAMLALKCADAKTHSGVLALFSQYYADAQDFDKSFIRDAMAAQKLRQNSDYVDFFEPEQALVIRQLENARTLVGKIRKHMENEMPQ